MNADAFARFRFGRGPRRIPHIQSLTATDCGAACVAMVCAYHERATTVAEAREALGTGRDGTTIVGMLEGARRLGLRARPLRVEMQGLSQLKPGTVLFWNFNHFVVLESVRGRRVTVVDPAFGRRVLDRERLEKSFTGLCVELEPGERFAKRAPHRSATSRTLATARESRAALVWAVTLSLVLHLLLLAVPSVTGVVIDTLVPTRDGSMLTWLVVGAVLVPILVAVGEYCRQLLLVTLRTLLEASLSVGFLEHLMRLPLSFFQIRQTGDLMARMSSISFVRHMLSSSAVSGMIDGVLVVLYFALIGLTSPALAALVGLFVAARVVLFAVTFRRQKHLMSEDLERQALLGGFQVEMLGGIESIKSSAIEAWVSQRWTNLYVDSLNVSVQRDRLDALCTAARRALEVGAPLAVLLSGASLVISDKLSLGTMYTVVALSALMFIPVDQLCQTATEVARMRSYVERIDDVLDVAVEQVGTAGRHAGSLKGGVTLENLSFAYGAQGPRVVDDVSLEIAPRQMVAIVGRTGCGKSTLAKLILGLHRPTSGRIAYDGVDLESLDLGSVREQMGAVPQTPMMLDGSIRDNIAPGADLALEDVVRAAKAAHIHNEIMAMPMRYETRAIAGGGSFSGGQRQRIAIARAVARQPAIMLLDEATSSLDTVTETHVHARLAALPMTVIVIAHRLSTVRSADLICVMDGGRIVERGTHDELLAARGHYFELVKNQLAHEDEDAARQLLDRALGVAS